MNLNQYFDNAFWLMQAVVGVIFMVHSMGKIKNPAGIASTYGAPKLVGLLHGLVELVGGLLLIVNYYPQYVAALFALIMLGAIYFKIFKWKSPFFSHTSTGWEFDLILLVACLAILTK